MAGMIQPDFFDKWRRLVIWVSDNSVELATAAGIFILIVLALIGLRGLGRRILGGSEAKGWRKVLEGIFARTYLFFIVMVAAKLVSLQVSLPDRAVGLINILFVAAAAFQVAIWTRALVIGWIEHRVGASEEHRTLGTAIGLIRVFVTVAAFLIAIIVILDNVGVNVTGLIAGLGIGGIAIGLAAQGIFKDLFAALAIIFDRPFRKGDTITYGSAAAAFTGTVENIGLRTTRLRALDGEMVAIGNDKLLQDRIHNYAGQAQRRAVLTYNARPDARADLLARLAAEMEEIVRAQPQVSFDRAGLVKLSLASADFEIVFHMETADFGAFAATRQTVLLEVQRRAEALGLMPAPAAPLAAT